MSTLFINKKKCILLFESVCMHATVCMWRLEDNFHSVTFSFYHVGPENCIQVVSLDGSTFTHQAIYLTSP